MCFIHSIIHICTYLLLCTEMFIFFCVDSCYGVSDIVIDGLWLIYGIQFYIYIGVIRILQMANI